MDQDVCIIGWHAMGQLKMRHSRKDKGGVLVGRRRMQCCFEDDGGPVSGADLTNPVEFKGPEGVRVRQIRVFLRVQSALQHEAEQRRRCVTVTMGT